MDTPACRAPVQADAVGRPGRRHCLRVLAGAAAALGVGAGFGETAPERQRVRIVFGREESLCHLPLIIGQQLGFFRHEGLDVQLIELPSSSQGLAALAGGRGDVASGPFLQVLTQHGQGLPLKAFVLQGRAPMVAMGVSASQLPAYRQPADLRGQRIGVSMPGAMTQVVAQMTLARAGLRPADVTWVEVGPAGSAALSLRSGSVQAMSHIDPAMTQLEQRGEVHLIADTRTLRGALDVFGGPMPATCLYAPAAFVDRQTQVCQALSDAVVRSLKWLQTAELSDIIKTVPEAQILGDRALYLAAFFRVRECYSPDGMLSEDAVRTAADVASRLGLQSADLTAFLERSHTNGFVQRSRGKFKTLTMPRPQGTVPPKA